MELLHIGTFLAPRMRPLYEAAADAIERELGIPTDLTDEDDYGVFADDQLDVAFICSLPYVHLEATGVTPALPIAAPVLEGARYEGKPIYYSDVIVSADSEHSSFADLGGASWAYNEPLSQSGYGITRYHLVTMGQTEGYFGKVVHARSHARSIRMVAAGNVDAAAIDSQVLSVAMRDDPELAASLRIIDELGPSTIQPVMASRRLSGSLRNAIAAVMTDLHLDPAAAAAMRHAVVQRFVPVGPADYDDVRRMLASVTQVGFEELR